MGFELAALEFAATGIGFPLSDFGRLHLTANQLLNGTYCVSPFQERDKREGSKKVTGSEASSWIPYMYDSRAEYAPI